MGGDTDGGVQGPNSLSACHRAPGGCDNDRMVGFPEPGCWVSRYSWCYCWTSPGHWRYHLPTPRPSTWPIVSAQGLAPFMLSQARYLRHSFANSLSSGPWEARSPSSLLPFHLL